MPRIQIGGFRGGKKAIEPMYAEVDEDDVERLSKYKWGQNNQSNPHTSYAFTRTGGEKLIMHRFIMGLGSYNDDKRIIDHKDGNGLNNKKENLTICDCLYNSQSFRRHNANVGSVSIDKSMKRVKRWKAHMIINGVRHQKRFLTEEEARAYIVSITPTV